MSYYLYYATHFLFHNITMIIINNILFQREISNSRQHRIAWCRIRCLYMKPIVRFAYIIRSVGVLYPFKPGPTAIQL
jgi:hypothetical protein